MCSLMALKRTRKCGHHNFGRQAASNISALPLGQITALVGVNSENWYATFSVQLRADLARLVRPQTRRPTLLQWYGII
jgi:hypothetical protein